MKSPSLLVTVLVACVIVLGFNYWIASSRSVDLQGRIADLEGKVRRAAAERGAVELKKNEFQGELEKQRQQIDKIQSLHSFQLENANKIHQEEKAVLMSNITVNERVIQSLRVHLKELQTEYGKLQMDVYWYQKNQTNLQKKFSYDLSQCINQMKELKEQCEERIDEFTKKSIIVPQFKENKDSEDSKKKGQVSIQLPAVKPIEFKQADLEQQKPKEVIPKAVPTVKKLDPQTNERTDDLSDIRKQEATAVEEKLSSHLKTPQDALKVAAGYRDMQPKSEKELNLSEDQNQVAGQDVQQPAMDQAESEEIEREQLVNYDAKQDDLLPGKADKREQDTLNQDKDVGYSVDENEAESETDKQAALEGNENGKNFYDKN
ncbi:GOLM1 protein, partial [Turnix velox]|nr:GOLM1 protein [Turnix velox]